MQPPRPIIAPRSVPIRNFTVHTYITFDFPQKIFLRSWRIVNTDDGLPTMSSYPT
jgi:hypothetical protein